MRKYLLLIAFVCLVCMITSVAQATDILVVSDGCPPCDVVKRYLDKNPQDVKITKSRRRMPTPTLIIMREGREVDRRVGMNEILDYWMAQ